MLIPGESIHHTSIAIGTDARIELVFKNSVRLTVWNGFHSITIDLDCVTLEKVMQVWQPVGAETIPF